MLDIEEIVIELNRFCPWWNSGKLELESNIIKRDNFDKALEELKRKRILVIRGMRQVGKTTLMLHMISSIIAQNNPKRVLYCSFDLMRAEPGMVRKVIEVYLSQIVREPLAELAQDTYIFLDEVQKITDWGDVVKHYHDIQKKLHFIVSGSSALNLTKGAGEPLIGRLVILDLYPFSFREYLRYMGKEPGEIGPLMGKLRVPSETERLMIEFEKFKQIGGLPNLFDIDDEYKRLDEIRTRVDLSFARDIIDLSDIRNTRTIRMLFDILVENSAQRINYHTLCNSLGTKYETVIRYIDYLMSAFFIEISCFYSKGQIKSAGKNPKIYAPDHAFFILTKKIEGLVAETMAAVHLKRMVRSAGIDIYYWNDSKGREVDIVLPINDTIIPVEVKYKEETSSRDIKGLRYFCKRFGVTKGIVITKKTFKNVIVDKIDIRFIPLWLFLLIKKIK